MMLLYRLTSFFLGLVVVLGFTCMILFPNWALLSMLLVLAFTVLLLGRLTEWKVTGFQFWNFVGTPFLYISSSMAMFLFFENTLEKIILTAVVALGTFLYTEHLFAYLHVPVVYKTYSLEHLGLILNILIIFFLGAAGYGLVLFLQVQFFLLAIAFFALTLFVVYSMFWVSKIAHERALVYALAGALILTELFLASVYLPTGFYTNATLLAVFTYVFLGLSRAHVLEKLTKPVMLRYVALASIILVLVLGSAKWI